jgi:hypothetical protein
VRPPLRQLIEDYDAVTIRRRDDFDERPSESHETAGAVVDGEMPRRFVVSGGSRRPSATLRREGVR